MVVGKLALVTGAGGGIGRAVCQLLADSGAIIAAVDCNVQAAKDTIRSIKGTSGDHMATRMDVSDGKDVETVLNKVKEQYSRPPDVIVNGAGILRDNFLIKSNEEDFNKVFNINVKGTFLVTKKACQLLIDANLPGSIVNISSIVSKRGNLGQCSYASSKAAVETFTKCVAMEMAKYNVRCNVILPGFISTAMTEQIPEKVKTMFTSMVPMRRFGTPEEVAEVIRFLASGKSSYVTGSSFVVSGGFE